MSDYRDHFYQSADGLRLYARDYRCDAPLTTLLCLHGLTRNSADFTGIASHLSRRYRLLVADQRGRGRSAWDPKPANYQPAVYVQDMFKLLDELELEHVALIGTSMGGMMSMIMAAMQPQRIRGMIINDIGPVINPEGLERIKGYVGKTRPVRDWDEAVTRNRAINGQAFPDFTDEQWREFTGFLFQEDADGNLTLAYDPAIAKPFQEAPDGGGAETGLWPVFDMLKPIPTLLIRGAISDILTPDCVREMRQRKPDLTMVEAPNRGHAPLLNEPECIAAIDEFLTELTDET